MGPVEAGAFLEFAGDADEDFIFVQDQFSDFSESGEGRQQQKKPASDDDGDDELDNYEDGSGWRPIIHRMIQSEVASKLMFVRKDFALKNASAFPRKIAFPANRALQGTCGRSSIRAWHEFFSWET
jgi:hypothetical protein